MLFAYNGAVVGAYAAALPVFQTRFELAPLQLSGLLVSVGAAAIASMQLAGRLSDRFGARRVALAIVPILIIGILGIGQASSVPALFVFGAMIGFGNGGIDVAMNAIGVQVERHRPRPIMSLLHGMWSVGNLIGAALLLLLVTTFRVTDVAGVQWATGSVAALGIAVLVLGWRTVPETEQIAHTDTDTGARTPIPAAAWVMGVMAIAFGLGEGTGMDWSGVHLKTVAGVDAATASLGVTMIAAFMVVIRLLGDFLVMRFGRRAVTRFGGATSAVGYLIVGLATPFPVLLVGWALVGLGIGMIAPQVYAVAGHTAGGRGLAVVVTFGYVTFLVGPAIIGALASVLGIQHTMLVPAALLSGLILLARVMPGPEADVD
ncbi:MAG: MFS transporter [Actinobacteria bacterium HGW-Actinobacteria-2]|nr:MAG: MFS transporter [Actinobacteria bacterium HGW-Actinobacteria-2]